MKIQTLEVLGAAYKGGRANLKILLTHTYKEGDEMTLCGKIKSENLVDELGAADLNAVPTCKTCARKDPRNV